MTLATEAQVEALLGGVNIPTADFDALAELVDPLIVAAVGREVEGGTERTDTWTLSGRYRIEALSLPRWPIDPTGVAVTEDGIALVEDTTFTVEAEPGIVRRIYDADGNPYPFASGVPIAVTYTPTTPPLAVTVAAQAIARAWKVSNPTASGSKPSVMAGLRQLTIGRWSATAETNADQIAGPVHLTGGELALLRSLRDRRP